MLPGFSFTGKIAQLTGLLVVYRADRLGHSYNLYTFGYVLKVQRQAVLKDQIIKRN